MELVAISIWLDTDSLSTHNVLTVAMGRFGPPLLRAILCFSAVFATFSILKYRVMPGASAHSDSPRTFRWGLLAAHFASMAAFCAVSRLLFFSHPSGAPLNLLVAGWFAAGLAGIALAAVALIPAADWIHNLRATGSLWIWALAASVPVTLSADLTRRIWVPLTRLTYALVAAILHLFVPLVVTQPAQLLIGTPGFQVTIAPECSGFEGMGLILAFGTVWLVLFRKESRFPQALLLLPAGVVFIYLMNVLRITALLLIGNAGAPQIALGGFHSQAGWIGFSLACLLFCFAARRVPWIAVRTAAKARPVEDAANPTAAYLMPFLAILAAGMLASATSAGFEWLYPLRLAAALCALLFYRRDYRQLDWRFGWQGLAGGALVFALWIGMDRWNAHGVAQIVPPALAATSLSLRIAWIALRTAAAVITVPIAEELAFRGFLLRRFTAADFQQVRWSDVPVWPALLASSVLFGVMHGPRWPAGLAAGLLFGWLPMRRGRFGDAVVAHAVANALIAAAVLAFGQWQLW